MITVACCRPRAAGPALQEPAASLSLLRLVLSAGGGVTTACAAQATTQQCNYDEPSQCELRSIV